MNINSIQNHTINHQSFNKGQKTKESQPSVPEPVQAASKVPELEKSDEGQKGVLRLLQEGHFKGVADVRLRINFHDEISAMENEQLKSVADGETVKFINTITSVFESEALKDEDLSAVIDAFMDDAEKAKTDFMMDDNPLTDELLNDLKTAFEGLIAGLKGLIPETVDEAPARVLTEEIVETVIDAAGEEPVVSVPEEEPLVIDEPDAGVLSVGAEDNTTDQLTQLIEELTALFDEAEGGLRDTLASTRVLPEISEPAGNGVAFEKFLNIYNDLYGIGTAVGQTSSFEIEA